MTSLANRIQLQKWYPWLAIFLCMSVVIASNGMINSGITVFDEGMLNEFGWSVGQLKIRDSINFFGAAVLVVAAGFAVDRFGFKPSILLGLAVLSISYFCYSYVQTLWHVYALHLLFGVVIACAGNMVAIIGAASSMPDRRGLAVGITVAGTSIGGIVLPPFANWLSESVGWREAMRLEAIIPVVIFLAVLLLLKNIVRSASSEESTAPTKANKLPGVSYQTALRSRQFWLIAIAAGLTFYSVVALYAHLFLYMRGFDYSAKTAALGLSTLSLAALVGKLLSGWLSDSSSPIVLLRINMLVMLTGLLGVFYLPGYIWVFLLVTGLGWGGLHTLYNYVLLAIFGMLAAGKINASVAIAQSTGAGIGAAATGLLFDLRGDYSLAFGIVIGLMTLGFLLTVVLTPLSSEPSK